MEQEKKLDDKSSTDAKDAASKIPSTTDQNQFAKEELKKETPQDVPAKPSDLPKKEEENKAKLSPQTLKVSTQKQKQEQLDEREDFDYEEAFKSWQEYRVTGKTPRRRGYHASFVYENYLYVHGGHDIREGTLEKMYRINLNPKGNDNEWELIQQRGVEKPGSIGYHTLTLHENTAYLFGGSDLGVDNEK